MLSHKGVKKSSPGPVPDSHLLRAKLSTSPVVPFPVIVK